MRTNKITHYFVEVGENADPKNIIEIPPRALSIDRGNFYFEGVYGQIEKSRIGLEIFHLQGKPYRLVNKALLDDIIAARRIEKHKRQLDKQRMNTSSLSNQSNQSKRFKRGNNQVTNALSLRNNANNRGNQLMTALSGLSLRNNPKILNRGNQLTNALSALSLRNKPKGPKKPKNPKSLKGLKKSKSLKKPKG